MLGLLIVALVSPRPSDLCPDCRSPNRCLETAAGVQCYLHCDRDADCPDGDWCALAGTTDFAPDVCLHDPQQRLINDLERRVVAAAAAGMCLGAVAASAVWGTAGWLGRRRRGRS